MIEAVRALVAPVEDLEHRPSARRMRTLLDPEAPRSHEPFRVLEDLRQTVLEAAVAGPLLLVLEDMHWAGPVDAGLRRGALAHEPVDGSCFVLTVRSDDLHRRHPVRRTLAEIGRVPGARRLDLSALDRDEHRRHRRRPRGGAADASVVVRSVLARSEGNPLYAEELVAADPQAIPEQLSDLFLARVDALGDGPRQLLRVASVEWDPRSTPTPSRRCPASTGQSWTLSSARLLDATSCAGTR